MTAAHRILTNAHVLTLTDVNKPVRCVAVDKHGRILATGTESELEGLRSSDTQVFDLRGQTLVPGFFDCHAHLLRLASHLTDVDLAAPPAFSSEEIIRRLQERLRMHPDAKIVQGAGYSQDRLPGGQHLTRHDLDRVSTEIPVRIVHASGHAAVVNSVALRLLEYGRETLDPNDGEIVRDPSGEPTGLLLEAPSWSNLDRIVPEWTIIEALDALGLANRYLLERGITSVGDARTRMRDVDVLSRAVATNMLQVRVNSMIDWAEVVAQAGEADAPSPDSMQTSEAGVNWHRYHVGQAKLFSDGAITTRTCWLTEPFSGTTDNFGIPMHEEQTLRELIRLAHDAGWQIATHAIGDRAIDATLSAYAEAQRNNTRHRPGHRIEHAMLLDKGLIARMRRQNVWCIGQPEFLTRLGDVYVSALGEERASRLSPYATLMDSNVALAFSSDCPVVPGAPLDGMKAAMLRRTASGRVENKSECLDAETALYAYTSAPAFATRTERDRGTIEPGKWADFAVLSGDPTTLPVEDWDSLRVSATFVSGECLYGQADIEQGNV